MQKAVEWVDAKLPPRVRRGFSVPEILAVVAVIVIVVSILMPNFGQGREAARSAICQSQLHQHMVAAKAYAADQQRMLPLMRGSQTIRGVTKAYSYSDRLVLQRYLSAYEVFHCPSQDVNRLYKRSDPAITPYFDGGIRLDYGINHYGRGDGRTDLYYDTIGLHYDDSASPWGSGTLRADVVANQNAVCYSDADADASPWDIGGAKRGQKAWPLEVSFEVHGFKRHLNGYNAVGLDTSAVWRSATVPSYEAWYLRRSRANPHRP